MCEAEDQLEEARREVQGHGFTFENWVRATFFDSYEAPSYTQHWDVSAEANARFGGVPVSIKATKYGAPLNLGDAMRQFQIAQPFLLIVGFWRQTGGSKSFVNTTLAHVEPDQWRRLWAPITLEELQALDSTIKSTLEYQQARLEARLLKAGPSFREAVMTVNPKIDSKTQRRLQCSLSFRAFFEHLAPLAGREATAQPHLFDIPALGAFSSPVRTFNRAP